MILEKKKPIRDKSYLNFIRSLPCLIGGDTCVGVEAHHQVKRHEGTMGGKPCDSRVLALCWRHHSFGGTAKHPGSVHGQARLTGWRFWEAYGIDVEAWITRLNEAYETATGRKIGQKR